MSGFSPEHLIDKRVVDRKAFIEVYIRQSSAFLRLISLLDDAEVVLNKLNIPKPDGLDILLSYISGYRMKFVNDDSSEAACFFSEEEARIFQLLFEACNSSEKDDDDPTARQRFVEDLQSAQANPHLSEVIDRELLIRTFASQVWQIRVKKIIDTRTPELRRSRRKMKREK